MAKTTAIGSCLEQYLEGTSGIPEIKWANTKFDPNSNDTFLQVEVIPTARRRAAMGLGQQKRSQGLFSVEVCTPENLGAGAGSDLADIILERFDLDTSITIDGTTVSIDYAQVTKSFERPPFYCTPVTISWYSYTD